MARIRIRDYMWANYPGQELGHLTTRGVGGWCEIYASPEKPIDLIFVKAVDPVTKIALSVERFRSKLSNVVIVLEFTPDWRREFKVGTWCPNVVKVGETFLTKATMWYVNEQKWRKWEGTCTLTGPHDTGHKITDLHGIDHELETVVLEVVWGRGPTRERYYYGRDVANPDTIWGIYNWDWSEMVAGKWTVTQGGFPYTHMEPGKAILPPNALKDKL